MTWLIHELERTGSDSSDSRPSWISRIAPGLVLAAIIGLSGLVLERIEGALIHHTVLEALVIAMILGVLLKNLVTLPSSVREGATFASKSVLELAVVALGASINVQQVLDAGWSLIVAVAVGVSLGMASSFFLGKLLGLPSRLAYLVAVGNSICGNSAIAAVAPVVQAERREVASAIGLTAIAGVIVVVALPATVPILDLDHYQYGVIAGMAVYAVPQVVAAAFAVSALSAQVATLVKLLRVMCLAPVVLLSGLYMRRNGSADHRVKKSQLLPWFVIGFFALMALRSVGAIPSDAVPIFRDVGKGLTIWAMAGLGLGVELAAIRSVGPRVGFTSIVSMVLLVALALLLVNVLGIKEA